MNKKLVEFLTAELALEKEHLEFKRELISFYLKNTPENNFSKKDLKELVDLSSGFLSEKDAVKKLTLIRNNFPEISQEESEQFEVNARKLLNNLSTFIQKYSFSINNEVVVRLQDRTDLNLGGVSHIAGRGIWADKDGAYTDLAPRILKLLKTYVYDYDTAKIKDGLKSIEFKKILQ